MFIVGEDPLGDDDDPGGTGGDGADSDNIDNTCLVICVIVSETSTFECTTSSILLWVAIDVDDLLLPFFAQ